MKLVSDGFARLQSEVSDETGNFMGQFCEEFESEASDKVSEQEKSEI